MLVTIHNYRKYKVGLSLAYHMYRNMWLFYRKSKAACIVHNPNPKRSSLSTIQIEHSFLEVFSVLIIALMCGHKQPVHCLIHSSLLAVELHLCFYCICSLVICHTGMAVCVHSTKHQVHKVHPTSQSLSLERLQR